MCNLGEGIAERAKENTTIQLLGNLMNKAGVNVEKAMDLLSIDASERDVYRSIMKESPSAK